MKSSLIYTSLGGVCAAIALLATGCGQAVASKAADVQTAVLPGAEVVFYVDAEKGNAAPISVKMKEEYPDMEAQQLEQIPGLADLMAETGLEGEDFLEVAGSMTGLTEAIEAESPASLKVAIAALLDQAITGEQVLDAIHAGMEQAAADEAEMLGTDPDPVEPLASEDFEGMTLIHLPEEADAPKFSLLVKTLDSQTMLYLGTEEEIKAASTGSATGLSAGVKAAKGKLIDDSYFWMVAVIPDSVRAKIAEQEPPAMMGPAGPALQTIQTVTMSAAASDVIDFKTTVSFGDNASAESVHGFVNSNVLPFVMMMAAQGGEAPPVVNTIALSVEEDTMVLNLTLSEEDMKLMQEQAMQMN